MKSISIDHDEELLLVVHIVERDEHRKRTLSIRNFLVTCKGEKKSYEKIVLDLSQSLEKETKR